MAMVLKVVGSAPDEGYNLAVALIAGLSAVAVFTLGGTLWAAARRAARRRARRAGGGRRGRRRRVHRARQPRRRAGVARRRRRRPATTTGSRRRAWCPGTINEFPWFSFLLGDLHAHVLALPFTLLALGFALQVVLAGPRGDAVWRGVAEALAAGLAVGALYAINSWSYPVAAGLLVLAVATWLRSPESAGRRAYAVTWLALVLVASVVLLLPFWLSFDPAAQRDRLGGRAALVRRRSCGDQALLYGIFAGLLSAAFAARVLAADRPLRTLVWSAVAAIFAGSLLATADLAGPAALAALLAVALGALVSRRLDAPERFLWLLVAGGLICVLTPELVYVRDAFDGSDLYRMNTVFKLGYQAWLLLAVAAACALPWAGAWLPRRAWPVWAAGAAVLLLLGAVYPYAGTYARKDGFAPLADARRPRLAARARARRPGRDRLAARQHARPAVVLEAVGEDYSAFGHGRISTFTGRATVLGWAGHELQWDHEPGSRAGRRPHALHDHRPRRGARADRPLRRRLRRVRADRAHDLRRRRARQVGRARRPGLRPRGHRRSGGSRTRRS